MVKQSSRKSNKKRSIQKCNDDVVHTIETADIIKKLDSSDRSQKLEACIHIRNFFLF